MSELHFVHSRRVSAADSIRTLLLAGILLGALIVALGLVTCIRPHRTTRLNRAFVLLQESRYSDALDAANNVVREWPTWQDGYMVRWAIHDACGNFESAVRDYSVAIDLCSPDCPGVYYTSRAGVLHRLGRDREAAEDYARMVMSIQDQQHDREYFVRSLESMLVPSREQVSLPIRDTSSLLQYLKTQCDAENHSRLTDDAYQLLFNVSGSED